MKAGLPPLRVLLCGALLQVALPAAATAQRYWAPEARTVISDFSYVVGVAVDAFRVTGATLNGLISYDPVARRWDAPLTEADGYPVAERPTALGWNEHTGTLLLGTAAGTLWRVDVQARRLEWLTNVPGAVTLILADERGDTFVRTDGGWLRFSAGSFVGIPSGAPQVPRADDAYLDAMRGGIGLDAGLRRWRILAEVPGRTRGEHWIGTAGGGMARVDTRFLSVEWLPYGITTRAVTAIARTGERIWFGGEGGTAQRATASSASADLQSWSWPSETSAPRARVHAIAEYGGAQWVGTMDGLFRSEGSRWRRFDVREGLPSAEVLALHAGREGLWVGTARGVCLLSRDRCAGSWAPGVPVLAIAECGDEVLLGTRTGLVVLRGTAPAPSAALPDSRSEVRGLACAGGVPLALTRRALYERTVDGWREQALPPPGGSLLSLAEHEGVVWVGGEGAAARRDREGGWSHYPVPVDVPFPDVVTILPDAEGAWLGTSGGAVRLRVP